VVISPTSARQAGSLENRRTEQAALKAGSRTGLIQCTNNSDYRGQ